MNFTFYAPLLYNYYILLKKITIRSDKKCHQWDRRPADISEVHAIF